MQFIFRFIVGGLVVSLFAATGDVLKPKSFAGLFGAAPSVALATLGLTIWRNGKPYAALEARSMTLGAIALLIYAWFCMQVMTRCRLRALPATIIALSVWFVCAFGGWALLFHQ